MRGARPHAVILWLVAVIWTAGCGLSDARAEPTGSSGAAQAQAPAQGTSGPTAGAKQAEVPPPPGEYDPRSVRLPDNAPEQRVLAALRSGDRAGARQLATEALASADPASRGRLLWLLARAQDDEAAAQAALADAYAAGHPLSRWAGLLLAERLITRDPPRAVALASELDHGWTGANRARSALAAAQVASKNAAAAEPLLRAQIEKLPASSAGANVVLPLADVLAQRGTRAALRESVELCRRVLSRAPLSDATARAEKILKKALAKLPAKDRKELSIASVEDELIRGGELADQRSYDDAKAVYEKLMKRTRRDQEKHCKVGLELGRVLFNLKDRPAAGKQLETVARTCRDPDIKAWARYLAGSSLLRTGDPQGAKAQYEALLRESSEHSLADDALYQQAIAQQDAGDLDGMRKTLARQLARYPKGDMRTDARLLLAFDARGRKDYEAALAQLDALIAEGAEERQEGAEGRIAYWRARTLEALELPEEAAKAFADIAKTWPLSYHAQQALVRLRALDAKQADALIAELNAPAQPVAPLSFPWRKELDSSGWMTAVELLRVGEHDLGEQELRALGLYDQNLGQDELWLLAATLHEAGDYPEASQLARSRLRAFRSALPRGRSRLLWRIAYPRAYEPLIEQAAGEQQVPPEFVRAVAREESSFNPEAVSTALAYGLIQLIKQTAKIHGKAIGLPSDPASLKRPEINLRIGSHFIRELWQRYPQNTAIVPAAYNAGYVAADKWLRERGNEPLDEWIEHIPYRETRRYTRRVLQSYGIYAWLDTGKLPPLPERLPAAPTP